MRVGVLSGVREVLGEGFTYAHLQTQHGMVRGGSGQEVNKEGKGGDPRTFRMAFLAKSGPRS